MEPEEKKMSFRVMVLIATEKLTQKAEKMLTEGAVPMHYRLAARGTATSDMMDILGLGGIDKVMITAALPTPFANEMLRKFKKQLKLGTINSGIAFTMPMSGMNTLMLRMLTQGTEDETVQTAIKTERREEMMSGMKYALIAAIVNQGYSDEVVDAAREVGAMGGTVLHSRRAGNETAMSFWGLSLQEEKEIVLIAANADSKAKIMKAIGEKCGIRSEAKGIVLSLPIDSVIGLGDEE